MTTDPARGAAEALRGIERWSRRIFVVATIAAACLLVVAGAVVYTGIEYVRFKAAVRDALAAAGKHDPAPDPPPRPVARRR